MIGPASDEYQFAESVMVGFGTLFDLSRRRQRVKFASRLAGPSRTVCPQLRTRRRRAANWRRVPRRDSCNAARRQCEGTACVSHKDNRRQGVALASDRSATWTDATAPHARLMQARRVRRGLIRRYRSRKCPRQSERRQARQAADHHAVSPARGCQTASRSIKEFHWRDRKIARFQGSLA
jgi:hypothetical protein